MKDFTIISVYNNEQLLQECLRSSVESQRDISVEPRYINNTTNKFANAKVAYQSELVNYSGKYIILSHQDIRFLDEYELRNIYDRLEQIGDFGIIGVAGVSGREIISNIFHGETPRKVTENNITEETPCETVDECLFIIKNEEKYIDIFRDLCCDSWHMYAVEYCLRCRQLSEKVYVIPANIYHVSPGNSYDESYYTQLKKIAKRYKGGFERINCTMGFWHTGTFKLWNQIRRRRKRDIKNGTLRH